MGSVLTDAHRGAEMLTPLAAAGEEPKGFYRWETDLRQVCHRGIARCGMPRSTGSNGQCGAKRKKDLEPEGVRLKSKLPWGPIETAGAWTGKRLKFIRSTDFSTGRVTV